MRKAALIYNLASGVNRARRVGKIESAARVLREAGVEAQLVATVAPGSATSQARELALAGCDVVIACGGDGTINEVAQGIVESGADTALGIIPLGTANALATELGFSSNPRTAAHMMLSADRRRVAVGKMAFQDRDGTQMQRYWLTAASVGVDAELMYIISTLHKGRYGMAAYLAGGVRLLFSHHFAPFEVEFTETETGRTRREIVAYFLLTRIANFGKMFRGVAPRAALTREDATLILFKTRRRSAYMSFATAVLLGTPRNIEGVESVQVKELSAQPVSSQESLTAEWRSNLRNQARLRAEVDGEVVGTLPVRSTIIPGTLTMLFPRTAN